MLGSINSPTSGNTLEAFIELGKKASESTIPPEAPLGGILTVNGTVIASLNGNVLNVTALDQDTIGRVPPPGQNMSDYIAGMAGGGPPNSYNWAPQISDNATEHLQILQWFDNILLEILFDGYNKLNGGAWTHVYPKSIVDILGALASQSLVHRSTATDSLQHYQKPVLGVCTYNLPTMNVDSFLHAALTVLLLEIGIILDIIGLVATTDPWMVPALATHLGSKSRMAGTVNLMQNHMAAAAPREVMMPAELAYSYAMNNYVSSCPDKMDWLGTPLPPLQFTNTQKLGSTDRVTSATIAIDASLQKDGQLFIAWIAAWGSLTFTPVQSDGSVQVPTSLYGHVWAVLVKQENVKLRDIPSVAVAGPEILWVAGM
ncbi:putative extracellular serine-rich protein [Phaeoacremonium minimum UCRPA7]|uniref:Putative extracellular serine-rich protein n=1 Tax=Phaeoacremonium minimum (strain UCR-PA7) TaxID=1286976 RepID=R8BAR8_PHAM7|nr:putative extracellular serine-rich protein [Phaeoacremonium minimum UCRPA7]EON96389.1 putative extracellular serine-rich protein [Phaeoacremonium minimum UCRPA7]